MSKLLVSVRSVGEALSALAGGGSIIDVKEPARGPLGRAEPGVWRSILEALPVGTSISVALGELSEWAGLPGFDPHAFDGIAYRKIGLAQSGPEWRDRWSELRLRWQPGPPWIAVIYSDWQDAGAPHPDEVLEVALESADCSGILIDTWDKSRPSDLDHSWIPWLTHARRGGLTTALAGGLDEPRIEWLAPLEPDWFAVRGAACLNGGRKETIDPQRVARLARLVDRLSHARL